MVNVRLGLRKLFYYVSPDEYDEIICAASSIRAVTTITVASCYYYAL